MEKLTYRLLPFQTADGPTNMAADEVLLQAAQKGVASLRFYGWSQPTLSLGYFQSERLRQSDPLLATLPFVRRFTGGETLVHHFEVTYALAMPPGPWQNGDPWPIRMHRIIAAALDQLEVKTLLFQTPSDHGRAISSPLCFQHFTPGDVILQGCKIVGSAQRRRRGALMQHGGILLAQSPHTPLLPGILELTGKDLDAPLVIEQIQRAFASHTDARCEVQPWSLDEVAAIADLRNSKYATPGWNCKR